MKNRNKLITVLALVFGSLGITFGLLSFIYIKNNNELDSKNWNVYFANLRTSIISGEALVPEEPVLESTSIKSYDVLLSKPGDYAVYNFDVVNSGSFDASLDSLIKISPICTSLAYPPILEDEQLVCDNLEYTLTYTETGEEVSISDILAAGEKKNIILKIGYDANALEIPSESVQITTLDLSMIYNQKQ